MKKSFLFLLFVALSSGVSACVWCDQKSSILALNAIKKDARSFMKRSALVRNVALSSRVQPIALKFSDDLLLAAEPVQDRFYTDYLLAYFPNAQVITNKIFPTMCEEAVRRAFESIVYFTVHMPWRYFVNDAADFVLEQAHIHILIEQFADLSLVARALQVDPRTQLVKDPFLHPSQFRSAMASRNTLLAVWKQKGKLDAFSAFVALRADLIIHLLYNDIRHEEYLEAQAHLDMLERAVTQNLRETRHEQRYQQAVRLFTELLKMLEQRLWQEREGDSTLEKSTYNPPSYISLDAPAAGFETMKRFLDSFVQQYEVNITGKFTHEYHPVVLEETARSFEGLEASLTKEGMPIVGRLTLLGYEEQGITRYKTRYSDANFSDEMTQKTDAGWSLKMFNRFGLLTGFLFKDANRRAASSSSLPVTHIDADQVEIFDGLGTIFQEHALGEAYLPTLRAYKNMQLHLKRGSFADFADDCMRFWSLLYSQDLKVTGKQHVAGTQDILFSIAYMRYLRRSSVPMLHFYVGPDITYPIETSLLHNKESTKHAQAFVKIFAGQLKPVDDKKTAYVFCSFVDGVGKSTMLGNLQNMMKHGTDVEKYEHVDNSSSQLATVFPYASKVVIADLPAQVSHFTYKPDGHVYVDVGACLEAAEVSELQEYVRANKATLEQAFKELLGAAATMPYDLVASEKANPELSFAHNLGLLKKTEDNEWVSFARSGNYYLFNKADTAAVRVRVPLATAPSHGLKNCASEQMIFDIGLRFPMAYDYFLQDLLKQLKEQQVEQVVMVDFLSMYSRASRENIRVNYIIQQMALLNKNFVLKNSFYQDFVHNAQLLAALDEPGAEAKFIHSLNDEATLRLVLFNMLFEHATTNIDGIDLATLTKRVQSAKESLDESVKRYAAQLTTKKVSQEHARLFFAYGQSREYVTLQQFNASDLIAWSERLVNIFGEHVPIESIKKAWVPFEGATQVRVAHFSAGKGVGHLDNGLPVEIIERIPARCRDGTRLKQILRLARARWHAVCANLLYSVEKFPVLPLLVYPDKEGQLCFVQPQTDNVDVREVKRAPDYSLFGVPPAKDEQWGVYEEALYLRDWSDVRYSHGGVYAYGHELSTESIERQGTRSAIVSNLYTQFAQVEGDDKVLVPERLAQLVEEKRADRMKELTAGWLKDANKNGVEPADLRAPVAHDMKTGKVSEDRKVHALSEQQCPSARLYLRLIATLDMIAKDTQSDFALRRGNRADFVAHMELTERITLPWIFGLMPRQKLFDSYDDIEPLISLS